MSTGRLDKVFMCMEQYERILRCYREPRPIIDIQHFNHPPAGAAFHQNEHILAMCNNQVNNSIQIYF